MLETVLSTKAAPPAPSYVQAVVADGAVCYSGNLAIDTDSEFVGGTAAEQAKLVLQNRSELLIEAGSGMGLVCKTTVFIIDMADFAAVNDVCCAAFGDHRPARSMFAVSELPRGGIVEIEALAKVR